MRIGACRKTAPGTMCPSYMATREEEHATRGRANALVRALSQPDPHAALGDERLHEILDLCLECKACKRECPLSVDMASLKSEFLAHYQDIHGVPLRSRAFAAIRTLNRLGAATAPVSNWLARRCCAGRWASAPARGRCPASTRPARCHRRAPRTRRRRAARRLVHHLHRPGPHAARRSGCSRRAGGASGFESRGCCGRASISKGRLDQARAQAAALVARLAPEAERGVPIVGVEPSCLLTLREEFLTLLPDDPRARPSARQARLIEELLARRAAAAPTASGRVLFHGHCHQKALAGTDATVALLRAHRRRGRRARRRLLRHGRLVRLRGRALRPVDADRRGPALPRRARRAGATP